MAGMPFPPYYSHPSHSPAGQFRSPYSQMPLHMSVGGLSMQSMTSHWNLPPPSSTTPPQSMMVSNRNKVTPNHNTMGGLKPPKAPEKPLLPYMRYSRKMWEQFKKTEGSDLKVWEVGKIIGQKWRELSEDDKQPYVDEYEADKLAYDESMRVYKNSLAYKQYLEAKRIADRQGNSGLPTGGSSDSSYIPQYAPAPPSVIAPPRHPAGDPRLLMIQQQQEDDEEDEYVTAKQVSAARYHRNHRLMNEIFNDSQIPNTSTAITVSRLESLKLQSKSLALHQMKLEDEVQQLEDQYVSKRTQFLEDAERFRRELKRIQDNPPTTWKKPPIQLTSKDIPESLPSAKYTKL